MYKELYTQHRPKNHSAHRLDGKMIVEPQTTEIGLVLKLKRLSINLRKYDYYNNRGDETFLAVNWKKK